MRHFWDKTPYSPGGGGFVGLDHGVSLGGFGCIDFVGGGVTVSVGPTGCLVVDIETGAGIAAGNGLFEFPAGTVNVGANVDGSIVVNPDDIQVGAAIQAGAALGASSLQVAGAGLTEAPAGTVNVGQNADSSILINADDIQLNPAYGLSLTGGTVFMTQAAWFVNSTTGNDANDGATALTALLTLGELSRRFNARILTPAMVTLTITLDGNFAEILDLQFDSPGATNITIQGTMGAASFSGTIDTYTAFNPAGGVRASILDAGIGNFTPFKQQRIRITSGAANTGVTSYTSVVALTTANIGQLYTVAFPETNTAVNAANGDSYTVEPWSTQALGLSVNITGRGSCVIRDMRFAPAAAIRSYFMCGSNRVRARFYGCMFDCTQQHIIAGIYGLQACTHIGAVGFIAQTAMINQNGHCAFSPTTWSGDVNLGGGSSNMHDGDGVRPCHMNVAAKALINESNHRCFFGSTNTVGIDALALFQGQSVWDLGAANARFWGSAGNLTTNALVVQNGCGVMYVTKPTATGVAPGTDVVLAAAPAVAWAIIPAVSAPPDNAYVNVRH